MQSTNIIPLGNKEVTDTYRKHSITITYKPNSNEWAWSFVHTRSIPFNGTCATLANAKRAAHRRVDLMVDGT